MALLRVLADILFYVALGLGVYWYLTKDTTALWLAIVFGIFGLLLFILTTDVRRQRRNNSLEAYNIWDWWFYADLLEIPFRMLIWLLSRFWRIFD